MKKMTQKTIIRVKIVTDIIKKPNFGDIVRSVAAIPRGGEIDFHMC